MPNIRVYPNARVKPESAYLQQYQANVTSQCGEDGIVEKIFEIMGVENQWCVEFGAWDGKHFSNSWSLINQHAWNGVLIEGDSARCTALAESYKTNNKVVAINKFVGVTEGQERLDRILSDTTVPVDFDLLSIDIDGCDWYVWESLKDYRPRLILIEFNPSIPNNVSFVQDRNPSLNHGSSLRAMIELGKDKGYELVATTAWNGFFVRQEDYHKFSIADNSIDAMHDVGQFESFLFQLYDGTMMLAGCDQLIWQGIPINLEDIQVLPRALRRFGG